MSTVPSHPSEKEFKRPSSSRPAVSSKCLLNLKNIVAHNVSANSHTATAANAGKTTELVIVGTEMEEKKPRRSIPMNDHNENHPINTRPLKSTRRSTGPDRTAGTMAQLSEMNDHGMDHSHSPEEPPIPTLTPSKSLMGAIPLSVIEQFAAIAMTTKRADPLPQRTSLPKDVSQNSFHRHSHGTATMRGKSMSSSKDIPIPIFRHESPPSPVPVPEPQQNSPRVFVNSSFHRSSVPANFGQYTRLPHALRNQPTMVSHPSPFPGIRPYRSQMPLHSRRSLPQAARPRTSIERPHLAPQTPVSEISPRFDGCCDSPSTSSNSDYDASNVHRRMSGKQQRSTTSMEQSLIDSEERSTYFQNVTQTREIMRNVSQRLREDLDPSIPFPLVDTHCHFDLIFERMHTRHNDIGRYFQDYNEYYPSGLSFDLAIQVFWRPKHLTEKNWSNWYSKYLDDARVYGSCGIHPHWSSEWTDRCNEDIERCLQHPKVVAIGEIGLDFGRKNKCSLHVQCRAFEAQLKLAAKWNKPIVIHSRDAYEETFKLMKEYLAPDHKVHLHCFVGNLDHVDLFTSYFTEMKFGFTPIISRNSLFHPVLQQLELHQILCETDSPYFIPDELSNVARCAHPGIVYSVVETIAKLRCLPMIDVARQLRENARHIYGV